VGGIKKDDLPKIIKKVIEGRLNEKLSSYLNLEHDIELEEALILLFNTKKRENDNNKLLK